MSSKSKNAPPDPPPKLNFSPFGDILIGPRVPEVPYFRLNWFGPEDHGFDPHQRQFFFSWKTSRKRDFLLERTMTCVNLLYCIQIFYKSSWAFMKPRCYSFGFIWVQGGVGLKLSAVRHWRRLNFSRPTTASKFSKNRQKKQIILTKNILEHAKNILPRPGQLWTQRLLSKMWTQLLNWFID